MKTDKTSIETDETSIETGKITSNLLSSIYCLFLTLSKLTQKPSRTNRIVVDPQQLWRWVVLSLPISSSLFVIKFSDDLIGGLVYWEASIKRST